ncbi:hypothetical protein PVK06_035137 [Gossypium arboreum]|uniref:Uncharacterized protein n=1 Tax=Gossypium arboreum TaxID=29729 RepID=A0ABR0NG27_GOSAR|nr:hypothetical protein PVK06_035137 [Gossypium arboreum]
MTATPISYTPLSSKARLVGKGLEDSEKGSSVSVLGVEKDFDFVEGDITRSIINGILAIVVSRRAPNLLAKDMANTTVIKLLDRNMDMRLCIIGFQFFGDFLSYSNSWILKIVTF